MSQVVLTMPSMIRARRVGGQEALEEAVAEEVEVGLVLGGEDGVRGVKAVGDSVLGGGCFAGGRGGSAGLGSVATGGLDLRV
jgi:hypothetical protein